MLTNLQGCHPGHLLDSLWNLRPSEGLLTTLFSPCSKKGLINGHIEQAVFRTFRPFLGDESGPFDQFLKEISPSRSQHRASDYQSLALRS